MTGRSGQVDAPSWKEIRQRSRNVAEDTLSGQTQSVTGMDFEDWQLGDGDLEKTLLDSADSIDDFPDNNLLYRFDRTVSKNTRDTAGDMGSLAGLGMVIGFASYQSEGAPDELRALGGGLSAFLTGVGLLGTRSSIRLKDGEYGDRQLIFDSDSPRRSAFHPRLDELLDGEDPVAVNFLDDQFANKYRDSEDLVEEDEIRTFLEYTERDTDSFQIWLDYDEDQPLWTLQVEGECSEPTDIGDNEYKVAIVGLNPEYEIEGAEAKSYDEILDELYGDSFRDYRFPEDAEDLEKELEIQ